MAVARSSSGGAAILYHIIYHITAEFLVRLLQKDNIGTLQKSKKCGKTRRKKSTDIKSNAKIVRFQQFSKSDSISHGADIVMYFRFVDDVASSHMRQEGPNERLHLPFNLRSAVPV